MEPAERKPQPGLAIRYSLYPLRLNLPRWLGQSTFMLVLFLRHNVVCHPLPIVVIKIIASFTAL
eukprot:793477-Pleurochrysis_carterae.AAC.2